MSEKRRPVLDLDTAWQLVHESARRELANVYQSTKLHRHYRISRVENTRIVIERLDGDAQPETLGSREVRSAGSRINEAGGEIPRGQLFGNVAKEVTLVRLHPELRWSQYDSVIAVVANAEVFAGDIDGPETFVEGAVKRIAVNVYERDRDARAKCIAHHGTSCHVCGINFADRYGPLGEGFIHVHHLRPLASIGESYRLDPIADLRPVCPNCHAMIHREDPPLQIDELKALMRQASGGEH